LFGVRLCPPYENSFSRFSFHLLLFYSLLAIRFFLFATPMRGGGAPTAARVQRHPRPAITLQARHPPGCLPPSAEGGAPLGAPPWRFWAGGRASFSGISSGSVQRAPRSQVIVPGGRDPGPLEATIASRSRETPHLAPHSGSPLEAPLMSQANPTNKRFSIRSQSKSA
jgi:hypothetical protein